MQAVPGIFSPGNPAAFRANFQAAMRFLDGLEQYCGTAKDVDAYRSCPAYSAFMKKWNLAVYCSLLYQDIAGGLEDVAQNQPSPSASQVGNCFPGRQASCPPIGVGGSTSCLFFNWPRLPYFGGHHHNLQNPIEAPIDCNLVACSCMAPTYAGPSPRRQPPLAHTSS